jgi:cell division protease FtsH
VNEAALLAARQGKREIDHLQLEEGIMRVIAGPEKKTRVMSEKERAMTAFHEMGHALVAHYLDNTDPVHKISVISRGQALGYTISLPTEDKFLTTRAELYGHDGDDARRPGCRGDRVRRGHHRRVERPREGHADREADGHALRHVEKLGPRVFGHDHGQPFLGREFSSEPDYSDEIAREIDDEIRRIVEEAHQTLARSSTEHRQALDVTSEILLRRETIEREQFIELLEGKSEEDVFGVEEPALPAPPPPAPEAPERKPAPAPSPKLPRPGLAGGSAD